MQWTVGQVARMRMKFRNPVTKAPFNPGTVVLRHEVGGTTVTLPSTNVDVGDYYVDVPFAVEGLHRLQGVTTVPSDATVVRTVRVLPGVVA